MTDVSGSTNADLFAGARFYIEWIEFDAALSSLSDVGFDIADGTLGTASPVTAGQSNSMDITALLPVFGNGGGNEYGVRITTTIDISTGGNYTFTTSSDDGSRLYVDGAQVVDNDGLHGTATENGVVNLSAGQHEITVIFFENGGAEVLDATIQGPDFGAATSLNDPSVVAQASAGNDTISAGLGDDTILSGADDDSLTGGVGDDSINGGAGNDTIDGDNLGTGLEGTDHKFAYSHYELGAGTTANLSQAGFVDGAGASNNTAPTEQGTIDTIDINAIDDNAGGNGERFGIALTTELTVTTAGNYTFTTTSDDGSRLFVDGVLVVDNDGLHGSVTQNGIANLSAGDHLIEVIFFENTGGDVLESTVSGADTGNVAIDLADANIGLNFDDTITGGEGNDSITGGEGNDLFIFADGDGADTISDFGADSTDANDGDNTNNDFVDLTAFYTNQKEFESDLSDDGILNHSDGSDYSDDSDLGDGDTILGLAALNGISAASLEEQTGIVCFVHGTKIDTANGETAVEKLAVGDHVLTKDNELEPVRWIGSRCISVQELKRRPKLRPICIRAGALGVGTPERDLFISPQHRLLVRSKIARRMFDCDEVLVAAKALLSIEGIDIVDDGNDVTYFHILFDQHEIVFANCAEAESLYPGPMALKTLSAEARAEIFAILPELTEMDHRFPLCRLVASNGQGNRLAMRHSKNGKSLVASAN